MNSYFCMVDVLPFGGIGVMEIEAESHHAAECAAMRLGRERWGASVEMLEVVRTDRVDRPIGQSGR